jgi:hypothetical protein
MQEPAARVSLLVQHGLATARLRRASISSYPARPLLYEDMARGLVEA